MKVSVSGNPTPWFLILIPVLSSSVLLVNGLLYPPKYQPELDQLSLEKYVTDDYLFQMHINCLLYDGPCDPVGRWMKPRMASYFLSSCILCTPNQEKEADKFMTWLYSHHPQLFRIGIAKYLDANGITLPAKSKFREQVQKMNVPKVSISSESSEEKETVVDDRKSSEKESEQEHELKGRQELLEDELQAEARQPQDHEEHAVNRPSERILSPNSRKNKFSAAIAFSQSEDPKPTRAANKINRLSSLIEDDEAEMDFTFYH